MVAVDQAGNRTPNPPSVPGEDAVSGTAAGAMIAAAGLVPLLCAARPAVCAWPGSRRSRRACVILAGDLLHSPISTLPGGRQPTARRWRRPACCVRAGRARGGGRDRAPPADAGADGGGGGGAGPHPAARGRRQANLLVPLYGVLIAAWARATPTSWPAAASSAPQLGLVGWTAAALIGWSAISLLWSADRHQGGVQMLFFYLPFGYLLTAARGARARPPRQLRWMLTTQVALGLRVRGGGVLAVRQPRHVFWNQKIIVGNEYASFFRVNSLFYDASIYGRFMAVTIVLLAAVAVYRRATPQLLALMAVLFAGLVPGLLAVQPAGAGGRRRPARRHRLAAARRPWPSRWSLVGVAGLAGVVARQAPPSR